MMHKLFKNDIQKLFGGKKFDKQFFKLIFRDAFECSKTFKKAAQRSFCRFGLMRRKRYPAVKAWLILQLISLLLHTMTVFEDC